MESPVELSTTMIIAIAVAAVVVLAVIAAIVVAVKKRKAKRDQLKQRYGAEYARTVDDAGSKRKAEEQLSEREARREQLDIRPISSGQRSSFRGRFEALESSFIDSPEASVRSADALLDELAETRGYPVAAADQRLEDLAVDHPAAVDRYRKSRPRTDRDGPVPTEQYRQALIGSRALFEGLLGKDDAGDAGVTPPFEAADRDESSNNGHRDAARTTDA
ncbi:MAG: hypothetical protein WD010_04980 [Nitriliruptor sp.]